MTKEFDYKAKSHVLTHTNKDQVLGWAKQHQMNVTHSFDEKSLPIIIIPKKDNLNEYQVANIGDTIELNESQAYDEEFKFNVIPHGKTMTVGQLKEQLESLDDDDRAMWLKRLVALLTPLSLNQMATDSNEYWNELERTTVDEDWEKFKIMQNKSVKECIDLELSELGGIVRAELGLSELTLETQL